jgi:hypothetical protein
MLLDDDAYVCRFNENGSMDAGFGASGPTPGCLTLDAIDTRAGMWVGAVATSK